MRYLVYLSAVIAWTLSVGGVLWLAGFNKVIALLCGLCCGLWWVYWMFYVR